MTDEHAFRRSICESPKEMGPRLVFADWLEEQGDPWAAFIRSQIKWHGVDAVRACEKGRRAQWNGGGECDCSQCNRRRDFLDDMTREAEFQVRPESSSRWIPDEWVVEDPAETIGVLKLIAPGPPARRELFRVATSRGFIEGVNTQSVEAWRKWGPVIVRFAPVTRVNVMNKTPINTLSPRRLPVQSGERRWCWFSSSDYPMSASASAASGVSHLLPTWITLERSRWNFPTMELAYEWLSDRLIEYAHKAKVDDPVITLPNR